MIEKFALSGEKENLSIISEINFKINTLKVSFTAPLSKTNVAMMNLLCDLLSSSCEKYRDENLAIKLADLYGARVDAKLGIRSANIFIDFFIEYPDQRYIGKDITLEVLEFLKELIYKPFLNNKKTQFNDTLFLSMKNNYLAQLASEDNWSYIRRQILNKLNHPLASIYIDSDIQTVKKVTNRKLFLFYTELISFAPSIFFHGYLKMPLQDLFSSTLNVKLPSPQIFPVPVLDKIKNVPLIEQKNLNQSQICVFYTFEEIGMDVNSFALITLFNVCFGGNAVSMLFRVVREKAGLCYFINSNKLMNYPLIIVTAGVALGNIEKTLRLIQKVLREIQKGCISDAEFAFQKLMTINSFKAMRANARAMIAFHSMHSFSLDELISALMAIECIDVINFAGKVKRKTMYIQEGVK